MNFQVPLNHRTVTQDKSIFESSMEESADDDLYEEARVTVIQTGKASTSFLQRKLVSDTHELHASSIYSKNEAL